MATLPKDEYTRRRAEHEAGAARYARNDDHIANARLGLFVAGAAIAAAVFWKGWLHGAWLIVPALGFVALVVLHEGIRRRRGRAQAAAAHYARGIARLDGAWAGQGNSGEDLEPAQHPYAQDLDLFGVGSLFELLCTARTRAGETTLAAWLCDTASRDTVCARQEAVEELRGALDLREDLALLGRTLRAEVHPKAVVALAKADPVFPGGGSTLTAWIMAGLGVAGLALWFATGFFAPVLLLLTLDLLILSRYRRGMERLSATLDPVVRELKVFADVIERLERENFKTPLLQGLQARLARDATSAAKEIKRLDRLAACFNLQRNQLFFPLAILLLWGVHCGLAIDRWRMRCGSQVEHWLNALGELEALCALSAYAYEHPADPFPELVEEAPCYEATALGHPLLPEAACVRNNISLGTEQRIYILSGSNMSGKSTLLRSIGVNAVLALMGAPVRAERLRLSPLVIGATMRVQDSIRDGASRFYAEILRFKQMLARAGGPAPLLFLTDEILHGTNSHDRVIGARALIRALLDRGAMGLVTTHDLAITEIAGELGTHATNIHLADRLEGDKLCFDYKLRPGVVEKSNALDLMRGIGLPV